MGQSSCKTQSCGAGRDATKSANDGSSGKAHSAGPKYVFMLTCKSVLYDLLLLNSKRGAVVR